MKIAYITTPSELEGLLKSQPPIMAIDIGFSKNAPSCGIATQGFRQLILLKDPACYKFGELADLVATAAKQIGKLLLILESPLSKAFTSAGNPCSGGEFESKNQEGKSSTRLWYTGPGAATALAAEWLLAVLSNTNLRQR